MKKIFLLLTILLINSCFVNNTPQLTYYIATDLHYLSDSLLSSENEVYIKENLTSDGRVMEYDNEIIDAFIDAGSDLITFHYEATKDKTKTLEVIEKILSRNVKVGISIKPKTEPKVLFPYLDKVDLVLVMSVEPGFGGQSFIDSALDKIKYLKEKKEQNGYNYLIEVDGGINRETAEKCSAAGCEVVVAGTYIFKYVNENNEKELSEVIKHLKSLWFIN